MTDEAKTLVERLRGGWNGWTTLTESEAAALIETQAREIDRLINAGDGDVGLIHWQGERIEALKAEIERLREALTAVYNEGDFASVRIATLALGAAYD